IHLRTLRLNCLTSAYADLWRDCWQPTFGFPQAWSRNLALRTHYERRRALIEIDVLMAMELGLTLDELYAIYRIQFPVLRQNERDTWYDRNGRIVFTVSKGLPGVGLSRQRWTEIRAMTDGTVTQEIVDDTQPGGPRARKIVYQAPFDRCDREADYAAAWAQFEQLEAPAHAGSTLP
ncbi:MAG: hypothetical protein ACRD1L_06510, partial [Terriglobales bacterium]